MRIITGPETRGERWARRLDSFFSLLFEIIAFWALVGVIAYLAAGQ